MSSHQSDETYRKQRLAELVDEVLHRPQAMTMEETLEGLRHFSVIRLVEDATMFVVTRWRDAGPYTREPFHAAFTHEEVCGNAYIHLLRSTIPPAQPLPAQPPEAS